MLRGNCLGALAALSAVLASASLAQAKVPDQAAALREIQTLTAEAGVSFDNYSYRKAQAKLERALAVSREAKLGRDPRMAEVYIMLGVAAVAGGNDLYRGLHAFVQALRLNPGATVPARLATPQLLEMLTKAKQTVKEIGKPPTIRFSRLEREASAEQKAMRSAVSGLVHASIDAARRGYPIPVKAEAGIDVQAHQVLLYYRPAGTVIFISSPMQKTGTVFRGAIPAQATGGRYVHYYLEARDQRGRLAASFGSARSPTVIIVQ
jgi:hypothetical protein